MVDFATFFVKEIMEINVNFHTKNVELYTLSEVWSGVNWADLMAAQGAFGTDFYDRSTRTIVDTMLWYIKYAYIRILFIPFPITGFQVSSHKLC